MSKRKIKSVFDYDDGNKIGSRDSTMGIYDKNDEENESDDEMDNDESESQDGGDKNSESDNDDENSNEDSGSDNADEDKESTDDENDDFALLDNDTIPTVTNLLPHIITKKRLTGDLEKDMETFQNEWHSSFLLARLLPKTKLFKDFNRAYGKDRKEMKKQFDNDGVDFDSEVEQERAIYNETFHKFQERIQTILQHYEKSIGINNDSDEESDSDKSESSNSDDDDDDNDKNNNDNDNDDNESEDIDDDDDDDKASS